MKNKTSKLLVIDASIARSCGGENARHPTPKNCRDFLKAVLELDYSMVMTSELKQEWDKHQSTFARKWRVSMIAKKKFKYYENVTLDELRKQIEECAENYKKREAMWKDICLLEAAIITDKIVISLDEKVRQYFSEVSKDIPEIGIIIWLNPAKNKDQVIIWLEDGAVLEQERQMRYYNKSV
ncbi:hypothetical protein [Crocosphaera sp. XPORK-15E]|uniref:hypothetical protein n=1 Tax=Crocosphaera sp. XPORK-15E TaxID=3110247 RepID=UPI002B2043F6|nr:hypothetical protein [Crocosphaera sp. XPORK-15E]MEA5533324.1 hypothetical protein [Crocosphaera sp. XPORK-15E]